MTILAVEALDVDKLQFIYWHARERVQSFINGSMGLSLGVEFSHGNAIA